jgi:hypothetical protein
MTTPKTAFPAETQRDKLVARYGRIGISAVAAATQLTPRRAAQPAPSSRSIEAID